jgi:hypothetical protein
MSRHENMAYDRGDRLDQRREPHFRRQQSATALSRSRAQRLIFIVGTSFSCESLYSTLKLIKANYRPFKNYKNYVIFGIMVLKQNVLFLKF